MKRVLAIGLILVGVLWIIPAYFTLQTSFMSTFTSPLNVLGRSHLANWRLMPWGQLREWSFNSLVVCGLASVLSTLVCIGAGYGFVRYDFLGKEKVFYLFLLAMAVPSILLFLPRYLVVARAGLIGSYEGLILPAIMVPSSVFFARQYLAQIDIAVIEAARLDGASELVIFRSIILPMSVPLVIICLLSGFGASYSDFMWQYLVGRDLRTLTSGTGLFLLGTDSMTWTGGIEYWQAQAASLESVRAAVSVVQALPLLFLFAVSQKYVVEGTKI